MPIRSTSIKKRRTDDPYHVLYDGSPGGEALEVADAGCCLLQLIGCLLPGCFVTVLVAAVVLASGVAIAAR